MFYQFKYFGMHEYTHKEYGENFNFPSHMHQAFEFITVLSGEMEVMVNSNSYILNEGDALLVFPNQIHSLKSNNSKHMLCIFSPELVKAYSSKVSDKIPESNLFLPNKYLINTLNKLSEYSSILEKKGLFYSLCAEFDKKAIYKERKSDDKDLLYQIFNFVELNYNKDCSLSNLTDTTGFSYSYLSRYFKRVVGISFNDYVNQYRISNACYLLSNSDCSILQCALESGYNSLRSFNRNFVIRLLVTPNEYRNNLKK